MEEHDIKYYMDYNDNIRYQSYMYISSQVFQLLVLILDMMT